VADETPREQSGGMNPSSPMGSLDVICDRGPGQDDVGDLIQCSCISFVTECAEHKEYGHDDGKAEYQYGSRLPQ